MKQKLLVVLVIVPLFALSQLTPKSIITKNDTIGFYEFKPPGYRTDTSYKYPLIIFLHGVGERGNGTTELPRALLSSFPKFIKGSTMTFKVHGREHAFLILVPQMSMLYMDWPNYYVDDMIDYAKSNLNVDTNKIFLTGWSVGGGGAWHYVTSSLANAKRLAGIIPVSPAPVYTNLCNIARADLAVWVHHAKNDGAVPLHFTEDAIQGIIDCNPSIPPLVTYYYKGGHSGVADWAYDTLNRFRYPNIFQWMIGTSRENSRASNKDPVPDAGNDINVVLPSGNTVLNADASYDPNDVIIHYKWLLVDGPGKEKVIIEKPDFHVSKVSGLQPGNYVFRLTVTDEFAVSKSDEVKVTVTLPPKGINAIPMVNAGVDIWTSSTMYHLSANLKDYDGKIKSCFWRQLSGPRRLLIRQSGTNAYVLGMVSNGIYAIELTATDNHFPHGIGKDTVLINKRLPRPAFFSYFSNRINPGLHTYGASVHFGLRPRSVVYFFLAATMLSFYYLTISYLPAVCKRILAS